MIELDPTVADDVPWADTLTPYDEARLCVYLRLLDAEADGADWHEVARIVLKRDAATEPDRARRCWEAHIKRARWIAKNCYQQFSRTGES